jgi:hypothetical protein
VPTNPPQHRAGRGLIGSVEGGEGALIYYYHNIISSPPRPLRRPRSTRCGSCRIPIIVSVEVFIARRHTMIIVAWIKISRRLYRIGILSLTSFPSSSSPQTTTFLPTVSTLPATLRRIVIVVVVVVIDLHNMGMQLPMFTSANQQVRGGGNDMIVHLLYREIDARCCCSLTQIFNLQSRSLSLSHSGG